MPRSLSFLSFIAPKGPVLWKKAITIRQSAMSQDRAEFRRHAHFKFRSAISQRLQKRIESAHGFRQESLQLREYLHGHFNRLPVEGSFVYSRDELFRRGLLKRQPCPAPLDQNSNRQILTEGHSEQLITVEKQPVSITGNATVRTLRNSADKRLLFILPAIKELGGLEIHIVELLRRLCNSPVRPVVCLSRTGHYF